MKESTLAKITAAATAAKRTAQKALAADPNPEWTEHEMQSIDEWMAQQDAKMERPEPIRPADPNQPPTTTGVHS